MARRYEFHVRVARAIALRTNGILFLRREHRIHIFKVKCDFFYYCISYRHANEGVFDDFPKISDHFPNISEDSPRRAQWSHKPLPKIVPKSSEDYRRLLKTFEEDPKCFDDASTHLNTI